MNPEDYEKLIQMIKDGYVDLEDLVNPNQSAMNKAIDVRNLYEGALGKEVLRETGVSVPNMKNASRSQVESFMNKLKEERYPELRNTDVSLDPRLTRNGNVGNYFNDLDLVGMKGTKDINQDVGTLMHELGHAKDKEIGGKFPTGDVDIPSPEQAKRAKDLGIRGLELEQASIDDISDIKNAGHHKEIPKLREGWFGKGALNSLLKNNTFKSVMPGALVAGAIGVTSGDANAAMEALSPIDAEGLGAPQDSLEGQIENPNLDYEQRLRAIEALRDRN